MKSCSFNRRARTKCLILAVFGVMVLMEVGLLSPTANAHGSPSSNAISVATSPERLEFNSVKETALGQPAITRRASIPPGNTRGAIQTVTGVRLALRRVEGAKHTYEATISDRNGGPVDGVDLDLGALQANPDIRVTTTPMTPAAAQGTYQVSIVFPANGDWMLVVRVHAPSKAVELFTETVTGAGSSPSHLEVQNSPSRRALRAADPTFNARYNPVATGPAGSMLELASIHEDGINTTITTAPSTPVHNGTSHGFDLSSTIVVVVHSAAAGAWLLAVLGLAFANRVNSSSTRTAVFQFVAQRYVALAGGGLATVAVTGLIVSLKASAGLAHPTQLATTNLGVAYLAIFGLKMVLVAGGIVTSWRIGLLMPTARQFNLRNRLSSVGAMANDDPNTIPNTRNIFRLAETNLILAVTIIGCVGVLGQLHHAIQ